MTYITPERLAAIGKFQDALLAETDRGCALLAIAFLDEELRKLLVDSMAKDRKVVDDLLSSTGPIGSLSSRIDLSYALGRISVSLRKDLHLLRKIRNDFGHSPDPITFSIPAIASRCRELRHVDASNVTLPREMFVSCVIGALGAIHGVLPPSDFSPLHAKRKLSLVKKMRTPRSPTQ